MRVPTHSYISIVVACLAALSPAAEQQTAPTVGSTLTLEDAVALACRYNGSVGAAYYSYLAAHQATLQAYAPLLPTLSGSYVYNSDRSATNAFGQTLVTDVNGSSYNANANWRVFDLGVRNDNFLSARRSESSQLDNARQTLRQVLFNVQDQYFETLRAAELEKVARTEVERAQTIFDQTSDQVQVGKTARKDLLQAKADLANAKVTELQSRNTSATDIATLKSLIGLPSGEKLPTLPPYPLPDTSNVPTDLNKVSDDGIANRPDLQAQRESVRADQYTARALAVQAGVNVTLDATFGASFAPNYLENRLLTFTVSYPVFDGGASRAAARAAGYQVKAAKQTLAQAERDARAQIETAFVQLRQNVDRLAAAKEAYDAALENYNAAAESQRLGASTIIDVLTANVSLVTAESNQIQAVYDYDISEVQLRLATGERLLGEPEGDRLPQYK
ncbi:MAG: TolC family protein [Fimbriimonadaceae bacterium]